MIGQPLFETDRASVHEIEDLGNSVLPSTSRYQRRNSFRKQRFGKIDKPVVTTWNLVSGEAAGKNCDMRFNGYGQDLLNFTKDLMSSDQQTASH
ncbi:Hypothetical predicted protein [Octopus vulgaris]|uniref:Uncharacterized protein n=1 Tax=Octopus vulgaris TaxID=6645 RepID=A0AA36FCD2_OCTVU|nr:Hypothetical predicted protein [Octopus vulgaris]